MAPKKSRVLFLDLLRAFAVIMMVQGHTVDVFLADSFRSLESPIYSIWFFNRGLTAPIFLFTSGTVFSYLFFLPNVPFAKNPRVFKGLKRFLLLIVLAYLMRYPAKEIFNFEFVTSESWQIFFTVDVLHLIAVGILLILFFGYLIERFKLNRVIFFLAAAVFSAAFFLIFYEVNWSEYFHPALANYFSSKGGSFFPLFPWLTYIFLGAGMGSLLAARSELFQTTRFSLFLFGAGVLCVCAAAVYCVVTGSSVVESNPAKITPALSFAVLLLRIGCVLILNAGFASLARKLEKIPQFIILIGRNTLVVYVVHVLMLYGSAWHSGLSFYYRHSFDPISTFLFALLMIAAMILMVYGIQWTKLLFKTTEN